VAWPGRGRPSKDQGIALLLVPALVVAGLATFAIDEWLEVRKPRNTGSPTNRNAMAQFPAPGTKHWDMMQMGKKISRMRVLKLVGKPAPDFALPDALTGRQVRLSKLCRNKPVVLLFGSFG
jgi:hypothetical protein